MTLPPPPPRAFAWLCLIAFALIVACVVGCGEAGGKDPEKVAADANVKPPAVPSAHNLIGPADFDKFKPGRPLDEILKDVQWRGNFDMACQQHGKQISAITYQLAGSDPGGFYGELVLAIFIDDKFVKFVEPPDWKTETAPPNERRASRAAPLKLGDFSWLIEAAEAKPVDIKALDKEVKGRPEAASSVDPGLTVAWLLLRGAVNARREPELKQNLELRDRLNAARIKIGMKRSEVESVLGREALKSGDLESGSYNLYGSSKTFDIVAPLHFSNVLVVYREGTVQGVYSGSWVQDLSTGSATLLDGEIRWK